MISADNDPGRTFILALLVEGLWLGGKSGDQLYAQCGYRVKVVRTVRIYPLCKFGPDPERLAWGGN